MAPQEDRRTPASPARILVVDDEPTVRQLVVRILAEAGYDVTAKPDGWHDVSAPSADLPYDLIIANIFLPGLTGDQLVGYLQRLYPGKPILHLDALSRPIEPELRTGTHHAQPFRVAALLQAVASALEEPSQPPG